MSSQEKPKLFMVTVEFQAVVLATSRVEAEAHARHNDEVWDDSRVMGASDAHARLITKASELDAEWQGALPYLADSAEGAEKRTCAQWVGE